MPTYGTIVPCLWHKSALLGAQKCPFWSNFTERNVSNFKLYSQLRLFYSPMRFILIPMSLMPGRISRFMLCLTVMWMESPEAKR